MQKIHSYQIPSQDVLGALRAHGALAKIRQHDSLFYGKSIKSRVMPDLFDYFFQNF